jgi:hypothetical protein
VSTVHDPQPLYEAIVGRLATHTDEPADLAQRPPEASPPYAVVYPLPDRSTTGSITDPSQISRQLFQVTAVGATAYGAQWMQHKVRLALEGWRPTVAGWDPGPIELDQGSGVTPDRDGPVFITTDRFTIYVS